MNKQTYYSANDLIVGCYASGHALVAIDGSVSWDYFKRVVESLTLNPSESGGVEEEEADDWSSAFMRDRLFVRPSGAVSPSSMPLTGLP